MLVKGWRLLRRRAVLMNPTSKPALWPTITESATNSCRVGSTVSMRGAEATMESVIPVSRTILGEMALPGFTRVDIVPKT